MNAKEKNKVLRALQEATRVLNKLSGGCNLVSIIEAKDIMMKELKHEPKKKVSTKRK